MLGESHERTNCSETGVAGARAIAPVLLNMLEKRKNQWCIQVLEHEFRGGKLESLAGECEQKLKGIRITVACVRACSAFNRQALLQPGTDVGCNWSHFLSPSMNFSQSRAMSAIRCGVV